MTRANGKRFCDVDVLSTGILYGRLADMTEENLEEIGASEPVMSDTGVNVEINGHRNLGASNCG